MIAKRFSENSENVYKTTICHFSEVCNFQLQVFWYNYIDIGYSL